MSYMLLHRIAGNVSTFCLLVCLFVYFFFVFPFGQVGELCGCVMGRPGVGLLAWLLDLVLDLISCCNFYHHYHLSFIPSHVHVSWRVASVISRGECFCVCVCVENLS